MVTYSCLRCGYTNKIKTHMKKHFKRKKICSATCQDVELSECIKAVFGDEKVDFLRNPEKSPKNPEKTLKNPEKDKKTLRNSGNFALTCLFCGKTFTRQDNLKVHLASFCKQKKLYTEKQVEEIKADKDHIINELKKQIEVLLTKVGNTTYNYTQNNIVVQPFGKEDVSYIGDSYVRKLIKVGPFSCIPKLIKEIHFHPEHKENHNVKIPNKKVPLAKIYNGEEWEYRDKNVTIENMSDKAYNLISDHYVDGSNKYMDNFKELYEEQDKGVIKRIQKDAEIVILNNQDKE